MPDVNGSAKRLTPFERRQLQRDLAANEVTRAELARRNGVTRGYVTQFAKRYALEIDTIKRDLDNAFAGLWIADKENRIVAYQADYVAAATSDKAGHHEWIKARTQILHQVAEELGQLPPRATVAVVPVVHVLEGVDPELLK